MWFYKSGLKWEFCKVRDECLQFQGLKWDFTQLSYKFFLGEPIESQGLTIRSI